MVNIDINKLQEEIYALICKKNVDADVYFNSLPLGLDFSKKHYVSYKLENYGDGEYKNSVMLTVMFTGAMDNYDLEGQAIATDKDLNKEFITDGRIVRQNVWITNFNDNEEKTRNVVLQYYVNLYV